MANPFWGPNMNRLMDKMEANGVYCGDMAPIHFAAMMDLITRKPHNPDDNPEDAAAHWLAALEQLTNA